MRAVAFLAVVLSSNVSVAAADDTLRRPTLALRATGAQIADDPRSAAVLSVAHDCGERKNCCEQRVRHIEDHGSDCWDFASVEAKCGSYEYPSDRAARHPQQRNGPNDVGRKRLRS